MSNPSGADGDGSKSWVQFDEEPPNDQHAGQDPGGVGNERPTTPPVSLGPISPSKQVQETPPRSGDLGNPTQPVLPPPPQKNARTTSPVPLSQLPSNPLAPKATDNVQPILPPPPQAKARTKASESTPAVIDAQSYQVSLDYNRPNSGDASNRNSRNSTEISQSNGVQRKSSTTSPTNDTRISMSQLNASQLQNVPLNDGSGNRQTNNGSSGQPQSIIRQGFANGEVIVTLLPQNTSLPWVTPAKFRPELVPEELMAQGLTLTVEDYVQIMSQLVNDPRFTLYNICYKRILICWIALGFIILLSILFSGLQHIQLFGAGIAWLLVNAAAIFFCMWVKIKLNKSLEECIAEINLQLMKHKILLGLDDRGRLSCHKVNLCFIYFDAQDCLAKLQEILTQETRNGRPEPKLRITDRSDDQNPDIIMSGATNTQIVHQQDESKLKAALRLKSEALLAQYSQRWAKDYLRKRLDWAFDTSARMEGLAPPVAPRHLGTARCPCQYIEEHLAVKAANRKINDGGCCLALREFMIKL